MPAQLVAMATSLERSKKNNFRSFIYGQSFTRPANFVKIGSVDVVHVPLFSALPCIFTLCVIVY